MDSSTAPVPALKAEDDKNQLLVRRKLIDAAEGRLISVVEEFEKAFDILGKYPRTVTVFGSARLLQSDPECKRAYKCARELAKHDYAVVTGGGGGIMQAANHGAIDAGGISIGFNIHLPMEQKLNDYTTEGYAFEHFFGRKVAMTLDASGYVFCAGGFGTFDEMFEIFTLVQTGIVPTAPIVLLGEEFWRPLDKYIRKSLAEKYHTVAADDSELYIITDDINVAVSHIAGHNIEQARQTMHERAKRQAALWEQLAAVSDAGWSSW